SARRTVFDRRRQYLRKPIMNRGGRDDLNFPAISLLSNIVRLSARPDRGRRKRLGGPSMITLNEALGDAQRKRIAIGHFNVSDLAALKAVTGPARELKVPVLIGTSEGERDFIGVREIVAVVASLREEFDQPIFVNADHTHSLERAVAAAKAGYDMIGFDVSTIPLEKNIALTRQAVEGVNLFNR